MDADDTKKPEAEEVAEADAAPESAVEVPPHQIIQEAQRLLGSVETQLIESNFSEPSEVIPYVANSYPDLSQIQNPLSAFDKFPEVTQQLRSDVGSAVDLHKVRKLNLAATVETLERSVTAHESFPSADAGIAVAKLADQVNVLTRELEKSIDPMAVYREVVLEVLKPFTNDLVESLIKESKWLIDQFEDHIPPDKKTAFVDTVKQMAQRIGPSLTDSLEKAEKRLDVTFNAQRKRQK